MYKLGDRIRIDKYDFFDILWPDEDLISENILNNNSIVCKLHYGSFTMLFTGDIEKIAEERILIKYENNKKILNSTMLKAGHHGSKTSSTEEFVYAVKPQYVLIGVGENNKFGHPNEEVVNRFEKYGAKIYRTDKMGEIKIKVNKKGKILIENYIQTKY